MLQNRDEQGRDSGAEEEMRRIFRFSVLFSRSRQATASYSPFEKNF
jgi:hypothetical protein